MNSFLDTAFTAQEDVPYGLLPEEYNYLANHKQSHKHKNSFWNEEIDSNEDSIEGSYFGYIKE